MGMKYYFGKVLLIGSSSILILEATVCIIRALNICILTKKSNCVFCQREKRIVSNKNGYNGFVQTPSVKRYQNFTVLSCLIKSILSILKTSREPKIFPPTSVALYPDENCVEGIVRVENHEIDSMKEQIPIFQDNYIYRYPSSSRARHSFMNNGASKHVHMEEYFLDTKYSR